MKTDDLIAALANDARPVQPGLTPRRLLSFTLLGTAASALIMMLWLGPRPDLVMAMRGAFLWVKALYAFSFAVAGAMAMERLVRGDGKTPPLARLTVFFALILMGGTGAIGLWLAPSGLRLGMWLGTSYGACSLRLIVLAAPIQIAALLAARSLSPTRLRETGLACGLVAGGLAATVYAFHCPESTAAFVASWYTLGIAICGLIGWLIGPLALRWR